jgi:hypothetical protein
LLSGAPFVELEMRGRRPAIHRASVDEPPEHDEVVGRGRLAAALVLDHGRGELIATPDGQATVTRAWSAL